MDSYTIGGEPNSAGKQQKNNNFPSQIKPKTMAGLSSI